MSRYSPEEKVKIARHPERPGTVDFIDALFTDFFAQRGDRLCGEDASILGGIARFHGRPVTVIGHRKGKNLEENLTCNFGMPSPEGYRKAAERLGCRPEDCVVFEDSFAGIEAGRRAGGKVVGVATTNAYSDIAPLVDLAVNNTNDVSAADLLGLFD